MKLDLYVQGRHWATVDLDGPTFAEFLAAGMLTHARNIADELKLAMAAADKPVCSVNIRFRESVAHKPDSGD